MDGTYKAPPVVHPGDRLHSFPKLVPALTANVVIDPAVKVGETARGPGLNIIHMVGGSLKSEPDFPIKVDATLMGGYDFIRADPSGKQVRLDVHSVLKDVSGAHIAFHYSGYIVASPGFLAVAAGDPDAKSTDFGEAFTFCEFEAGEGPLRELEHGKYVASGRFIIQEGQKPIVEYKISKVVATF
ncbi:MAG: hypothetical protein M1814_003637 [Vezdaea aestivalis]|nr:MAG: hypothetical protein M1814_003637 [Vezdaea aestivalis]